MPLLQATGVGVKQLLYAYIFPQWEGNSKTTPVAAPCSSKYEKWFIKKSYCTPAIFFSQMLGATTLFCEDMIFTSATNNKDCDEIYISVKTGVKRCAPRWQQ
jgi:hypothetical protein